MYGGYTVVRCRLSLQSLKKKKASNELEFGLVQKCRFVHFGALHTMTPEKLTTKGLHALSKFISSRRRFPVLHCPYASFSPLRICRPGGSQWVPTKHSRVCSYHFVGGSVSNVMNHPSYVPTIFPNGSRKSGASAEVKLARHNR